jgi:hypothetical protein
MLMLPDRAIEYGGQRAALTSFVSRDGAARLDFVSDPQTLAVWRVSGAGARVSD